MLSDLNEFIGIAQYLLGFLNKRRLKNALAEEIESELNELQDSCTDLLLETYLISGAYTFGFVFPPSNSEVAINKIAERFESSYVKFEKSIFQLVKTLKIHEEEFNLLIGNDYENKIFLKNILSSVSPEYESIDWGYLSKKKSFCKIDMDFSENEEFISKLHQRLVELSSKFEISEIALSKDTAKLFKDKYGGEEFKENYTNLIKKLATK